MTKARPLRWTDGHMRSLLEAHGVRNRGEHRTSADLARALEALGVDPYRHDVAADDRRKDSDANDDR